MTTDRPTDVLVNFVLDKSGSMNPLKSSTIEGFNAFLHEQRANPGEAKLSLTLFDSSFDVRFVAKDLDDVPDLGSPGNRYSPSGMTALYDAVVTTIKGAEAWLGNHEEFTGDVITVIQTDGEENSSREADITAVNDLISKKTAEGWEFVFLGTGEGAWTEGQKFTAIPTAARFGTANTEAGQLSTYAGVSRSMTAKRASGGSYAASLDQSLGKKTS